MNFENENIVKIQNNIQSVIVGNNEVIKNLLVAFICDGHVLIEGVPGTGKTSLALAMAKSTNLDFNRMQFNPDTMPSDVTGFYVYNQKKGEFEFRKGGIFGNIILVDEINRTSPKVQASLLEAMEEKQVTVDGVTHKLPDPFIVIATQNPIEHFGTFPLPEAQLDRFFMKLNLEYPDYKEEVKLLSKYFESNVHELNSVAFKEDILELKKQVEDVYLDESLNEYIVNIVTKSRTNSKIKIGCSPRSSLYLMHAAKAVALCKGRDYVIPDDIKEMVHPLFNHRIVLNAEAVLQNISVDEVLTEIVNQVRVPRLVFSKK